MLSNVLFLLEMHQNCFWHGLPSRAGRAYNASPRPIVGWEWNTHFPLHPRRSGVWISALDSYPHPNTNSWLQSTPLHATHLLSKILCIRHCKQPLLSNFPSLIAFKKLVASHFTLSRLFRYIKLPLTRPFHARVRSEVKFVATWRSGI